MKQGHSSQKKPRACVICGTKTVPAYTHPLSGPICPECANQHSQAMEGMLTYQCRTPDLAAPSLNYWMCGDTPEEAHKAFQKLYTRRTRASIDSAVVYLRSNYTGLHPLGIVLNAEAPDIPGMGGITGCLVWATSNPNQLIYGVIQRGGRTSDLPNSEEILVNAVAIAIKTSQDQGQDQGQDPGGVARAGYQYGLSAQRTHSSDVKTEIVSDWTLNSVVPHWQKYINFEI